MGEVYSRSNELNARCVKLLPAFATMADASLRRLKEARTISALNHPNIITIMDAQAAPRIYPTSS